MLVQTLMKTASLGLLEVLGLVRMPGEGDVTALPLFRQGGEDSSLFYFWREESVRFCYILALSRGPLLMLCFLRAVMVCLLQAVKVWPLHGPNPPKFHLYARDNRQTAGDRTLRAAGL